MPLSIAQTKTVWRIGEAPPELTVSGLVGGVLWTSSIGTPVPSDEATTFLSAPNRSRYGAEKAIVTAQDLSSLEEETAEVEIYATFPFQPDWRFESEVDEDTEISKAEDNTETVRELGGMFAKWQLGFNDREPAEYYEALSFRAHHGKSRRFYLDDIGLGELVLVRFDSAIRRSPQSGVSISYSFVVYAPQWTIAAAAPLQALYGESLYG